MGECGKKMGQNGEMVIHFINKNKFRIIIGFKQIKTFKGESLSIYSKDTFVCKYIYIYISKYYIGMAVGIKSKIYLNKCII